MTQSEALKICKNRKLFELQDRAKNQKEIDKARRNIMDILDRVDENTHPIGADCTVPYRYVKKTEEQKKEESETYNGHVATEYSEENWVRVKKNKPVVMPKMLRPTRLDARNSFECYSRIIIVAKKNENTKAVGSYVFFDYASGIKLGASNQKDRGRNYIKNKIKNNLDIVDYLEREED